MPELPEVETIRRQLQTAIVGKQIKDIAVLRSKSFQGNPQEIFKKTIKEVDRQAKVLIISFKNKFPKLLIHLKMTGQLIYESGVKNYESRIVGGHPTPDWINELPSKHTRVIITFGDKSKLFFNDQRVFGWLKVVNDQNQLEQELKNMSGIEPLTKKFTVANLKNIFAKTSRPIKIVIMEQKLIAGVGNIYANDALYLAGINPQKPANKLTLSEIKKLRISINKVIKLGIKHGGASDSDYIHLNGLGGSYQKHFLVYKKDGQKCPKCGGIIKKIKLGGRGTYFCPKCQK